MDSLEFYCCSVIGFSVFTECYYMVLSETHTHTHREREREREREMRSGLRRYGAGGWRSAVTADPDAGSGSLACSSCSSPSLHRPLPLRGSFVFISASFRCIFDAPFPSRLSPSFRFFGSFSSFSFSSSSSSSSVSFAVLVFRCVVSCRSGADRLTQSGWPFNCHFWG